MLNVNKQSHKQLWCQNLDFAKPFEVNLENGVAYKNKLVLMATGRYWSICVDIGKIYIFDFQYRLKLTNIDPVRQRQSHIGNRISSKYSYRMNGLF